MVVGGLTGFLDWWRLAASLRGGGENQVERYVVSPMQRGGVGWFSPAAGGEGGWLFF